VSLENSLGQYLKENLSAMNLSQVIEFDNALNIDVETLKDYLIFNMSVPSDI
jgi:hypothetical protein